MSSLEVIFLSNNQLSGTVPRAIGNLTRLKELCLDYNKFVEIPREIGNLQLEKLSLRTNALKGLIPLFVFNMSSLISLSLGDNGLHGILPDNICQHLPVIQTLYLKRNHLSGPLPSTWQCRELLVLSLSFNNFSGRIPRSIGNLTRLEDIRATFNSLTGTIPNEFGNLHNLEYLSLMGNNLDGVIPSNIFNISTIRFIFLSENKISGCLPESIGLWVPSLQGLYASDNYLSGAIPKSISNASELTILEMTRNYFSGFIPNTLSSLRNLQIINLEKNRLNIQTTTSGVNIFSSNFRDLRELYLLDNSLDATVPASMGNFSASLEILSLSNNKLRGNIPSDIANLSNLAGISWGNNKLSGSIPTSIGRLQKLQILGLHDNMLQQSIPLELCHLKRLSELYLRNNQLHGSIPTCLGNLSMSLRSLVLDYNELTSTIPSALWDLVYILYLGLSSNSLIGSIPVDIEKLNVVIEMDLSSNQLSGHIPSSIGGLQDMVNLSLANNNFEGSIPDSFGKLLSMERLDLSKNNLSGEIPKPLETILHLKYLNLSFNKLRGEIPTGGPFANFSSQSFTSNNALCGAPRLQVPPCKSTSRKSHAFMLRYILPGILATIFIVTLSIFLILNKRRRSRPESNTILFPQSTRRRVSYCELLRATSGFNESNLIGIGSFGSVYRGTLSSGKDVAVKVFNLQLEKAFKSFDGECEVLRNIRHRNLIKIITSCSNPDFKALVLDYMPLGSLEKWLYSNELCLNFLQRLNIMIDVASALEYLHHGYSTPIVHCDLKPSNVLLDEAMVAHVADFGIARLLNAGDSMTQTMTLATIGYMAPEYGLEGVVSRRGDVYSYGIMLMETFTGKRPTDGVFNAEMNLKHWIENSFPHAITEVIDSDLLRTEEEKYAVKMVCLSSILELALACTTTAPEERKDMKIVVATLNRVKMKFLKDDNGDN
ncbi:Serine/threonine protein kinase [Parasponia andersonii]|uniref:non-specific serine/threonine protein kinase n=1 Tax=Parasponia andersonii TaxID=3476 RepID=A0A2P5AAF9_PARAD|nr:Serine/threonine protein kinase [Parasponia andersonii]